jgi:hypothetical protein
LLSSLRHHTFATKGVTGLFFTARIEPSSSIY